MARPAGTRGGSPLLQLKDIVLTFGGTPLLSRAELSVGAGERVSLVGRNGTGKSTLSYVIAGRKDYTVESGEIHLDGVDLLELEPDERAAHGVFLAFQYPIEIPGVATMTFLKAALNAQRKQRGEPELTTPDFMRRVKKAAEKLDIKQDMLKRALNVGFSGGEKKRNEILQMALLEPRLAVLDETDSGLDIDALKIVSEGVNTLAGPGLGVLVITHYQRILNYIRPDHVHILMDGRIVRSGGAELALELEQSGYAGVAPQQEV